MARYRLCSTLGSFSTIHLFFTVDQVNSKASYDLRDTGGIFLRGTTLLFGPPWTVCKKAHAMSEGKISWNILRHGRGLNLDQKTRDSGNTIILPSGYRDLVMERTDSEIHSFSYWAILTVSGKGRRQTLRFIHFPTEQMQTIYHTMKPCGFLFLIELKTLPQFAGNHWYYKLLYRTYIYTGHIFILDIYLYQTYIYTRHIFIPDIYLYQTYIYTGHVFVPDIYLYRTYICTGHIFIPDIYLYRIYIYTGHIFITDIYLYRTYIYTGYIFVPDIYLYRIYIYTGHIFISDIYL